MACKGGICALPKKKPMVNQGVQPGNGSILPGQVDPTTGKPVLDNSKGKYRTDKQGNIKMDKQGNPKKTRTLLGVLFNPKYSIPGQIIRKTKTGQIIKDYGKKGLNMLKDSALGQPEEFTQVPTQTLLQNKVSNRLLRQGMRRTANPYQDWNDIAKGEEERFQSETVPNLAQRFVSMGSGIRGSGFRGSLASAGKNLHVQLAERKHEHGLKTRESAINSLKLGLNPQFQTIHRPATKGWFTPENIESAIKVIGPMLL